MKKKIGPIIIIALSLIISAFFGVLLTTNYVNALEEFNDAGYILVTSDGKSNSLNEQRYFENGTSYKKSYDGSISFNDINNNKVSIDSKNFIHYSNNSLASLDDTVLLDTDKLDDPQISYYAISNKSTLTKASDTYTTQNVGTGNLSFKNFVWKVSDQRYMVVSNQITLVVSDTSQQTFSNYIELQYVDEGIAYLVNQDGTYSTISSDAYLLLSNGIRVYIGSKNVSDEEAVLVNLTQMVVNSDDNIEVIPDVDYNIESNEQPQIVVNANDGADGQAGSAGEEGNPGEAGNKGNQGTAGSPGTQGNPGQPGENAEGSGLVYTAEQLPSFSLTSDGLDVTAYSVNGVILFDNNDCQMADSTQKNKDNSLKEGYPATFMIINNEDNTIVWKKDITTDKLKKFIDNQNAEGQINYLAVDNSNPVATLKQNTVYTFAINATFMTASSEDFMTQQVFQQQFTTDSLGVDLKFDYSTTESLNYSLYINQDAFENSKITSFKVELYNNERELYTGDDGSEFDYGSNLDVVDSNNVLQKDSTGIISFPETLVEDATAQLTYKGLKRNTTYYARINVTTSNGIVTIPPSSFEYVLGKTLRMTPTVGQPSAIISEKTNSFIVSSGVVNDYDNGVTGYRYDFYEITTTLNGAVAEDTYSLVYSYETNSLEDFSVPVIPYTEGGEKSPNNLYRGRTYVVQEVALFDNNISQEEIKSVYSDRFSTSNNNQWPAARFELSLYPTANVEKAGLSAASIVDGTLIIQDEYYTIPQTSYITIALESTSNVDHCYENEVYTKVNSGSIPAWKVNTYYKKDVAYNYYSLTLSQPSDWATNYNSYYTRNATYVTDNTPITKSYTVPLSNYIIANSSTYEIEFTFDALKSETNYNVMAYVSEVIVNNVADSGIKDKGVLLCSTSTTTSTYSELFVSGYDIKSGITDDDATYSLLLSKPLNWDSTNSDINFTNYYTLSYVAVPLDSNTPPQAPTWTTNTYYYKDGNDYILTVSEPNGWANTYTNYFTRSYTKLNGITAPVYENDFYYEKLTTSGSFNLNIAFSNNPTTAEDTNTCIDFTDNCYNKLGIRNSIDLSIKSLTYVTFDVYVGTKQGNSFVPADSKANTVSYPFRNNDTYTSYTLLSAEPSDWSSKYNTYYVKASNNTYKAISASIAPTFVANTYYQRNASNLSNKHDYADLYKFDSSFNTYNFTIGANSLKYGAYLSDYYDDNETPINDLSNYYISLSSTDFNDSSMVNKINDYFNTYKNNDPYLFIKCSAAYDYTYGLGGYGSDSSNYQVYNECNKIQIGTVGDTFTDSIYDRWITTGIEATRPEWEDAPYFNLSENEIYKSSDCVTIDGVSYTGLELLDYIGANYGNANALKCISNLYSTFDYGTLYNDPSFSSQLANRISSLESYWNNNVKDGITRNTVVGYYIQGPSDWLASYASAVRYIIYENIYDSNGNLLTQVEVTKSYNNSSGTETDDTTDGWIYFNNTFAADYGLPAYIFFLDTTSTYNRNVNYSSVDGCVKRGEPFSVRMQVKLADFGNEVYPSDSGTVVRGVASYIEDFACAYKQEPKISMLQYDGNTNPVDIDLGNPVYSMDYFYANIQDYDSTFKYNYSQLTYKEYYVANRYYYLDTINEFVLLNKKPSDWSTNYGDYYAATYIPNTDKSWENNKYYMKQTIGLVDEYILLTSIPDGWATTYGSYYVQDFNNYDSLTSYTDFVTNKYYIYISGVNVYKPLTSPVQPSDWDEGYSNYYKRSSFTAYDSEYHNGNRHAINVYLLYFGGDDEITAVTPNGIFDRSDYTKLGININPTNLLGQLSAPYDLGIYTFDGKGKITHIISNSDKRTIVDEAYLTKGADVYVGSKTKNYDFEIQSIYKDGINNKYTVKTYINSSKMSSIYQVDIKFKNVSYVNIDDKTTPTFVEDKYYKVGARYFRRLTEQPSDWNSLYMNYFTKTSDGFVQNTSFVDWEPKKYYEVTNQMYSTVTTQPSDWSVNYTKYYVWDGTNYVPNTNVDFNGIICYAKNYDSYDLLTVEPNDWAENYKDYFEKSEKFGQSKTVSIKNFSNAYSSDSQLLTTDVKYSDLASIAQSSNTSFECSVDVYYLTGKYGTKYTKTGKYVLQGNSDIDSSKSGLWSQKSLSVYDPAQLTYNAATEYDDDNDVYIYEHENISYSAAGLTKVPRQIDTKTDSDVVTLDFVFANVLFTCESKGRNFISLNSNFLNLGTMLTDDEHLPKIYYRVHENGDADSTKPENADKLITIREQYKTNWTSLEPYSFKVTDATDYTTVIQGIYDAENKQYLGLNYDTFYDFVLVGYFNNSNDEPVEMVIGILENDDENTSIKTLTNLNIGDDSKIYTKYYSTNRDSKYLCVDICLDDIYKNDILTGINTVDIDLYRIQTGVDDINNEKPTDWDTNWQNYYVETDIYSLVTGNQNPEWAADTYYTKTESGEPPVVSYVLQTVQPADWTTNWSRYYVKNKDIISLSGTPKPAWEIDKYYTKISDTVSMLGSEFYNKCNAPSVDDFTLDDFKYSYNNKGFDFKPLNDELHKIDGDVVYASRITFRYKNAVGDSEYQYCLIHSKDKNGNVQELQPWADENNSSFFRITATNIVENGDTPNFKIKFTVAGTDSKRIVTSDNYNDLNTIVFLAELHKVYETEDDNKIKTQHDDVINITNADSILIKESDTPNSPEHKVYYARTSVSNGRINPVDITCSNLDPNSKYYLKLYACVDYTNIDRLPDAITEYKVVNDEPVDWSINYKNYYIKSGDSYVQIEGANVPTFVSGSVFKHMIYTTYTKLNSEPADWADTCTSYYIKSGDSYIPVEKTGEPPVAPTFASYDYYYKSITNHIFDGALGYSTDPINERNSYNHVYQSSTITTPSSGGILVYDIDLNPTNKRITFMGSGLYFIKKIEYTLTDLDSGTIYPTITLTSNDDDLNSDNNIFALGDAWRQSDGGASTYYMTPRNMNDANINYYITINVYDSAGSDTPTLKLEGGYTVPTPQNNMLSAPSPTAKFQNAIYDALNNIGS